MGISSIWHWIIVLVIVLLVFGTKKLRNIGQDLGGGIRGFREGLKEGGNDPAASQSSKQVTTSNEPIEGEVREKTKSV